MKQLVWLQTGFIGDVILTTAALELAAAEWPGVAQHLVTTPVGAAAIGDHPQLASCTVFKKDDGGTAAAFKKTKAELLARLDGCDGGGREIRGAGARSDTVLLQTHRSYRSSFLARYLGLRTITYEESDAAFLAAERVTRVAVLHEAQRIALLLEPLGVDRAKIDAARPTLAPLPLDGAAPWQQALRAFPGRLVGLAPGSVWGTKRWTIEGFCELAQKLHADPSLGVVLLGSDKERELAETIARSLPAGSESVFNLAGQTSLADLRRVFPRLSVVVSNDSSPLHYASALRVPTVALFGATVPEMGFGPLAPRAKVLGVDLACRPCSAHGPQVCPLGHFKCMRELSVESVFRACQELLA